MYTRGEKENDLDTIIYEINMLDHCFQRCKQTTETEDQGDRNTFLEGFLLHYRNLIEFFSGRQTRYSTDLSISKPKVWRQNKGDTTRMTRPDLRKKYQGEISKYLQHCTTIRAEVTKEWDIDKMYSELNEVLVQFENTFPFNRLVSGGVTASRSPIVAGGHTASIG